MDEQSAKTAVSRIGERIKSEKFDFDAHHFYNRLPTWGERLAFLMFTDKGLVDSTSAKRNNPDSMTVEERACAQFFRDVFKGESIAEYMRRPVYMEMKDGFLGNLYDIHSRYNK